MMHSIQPAIRIAWLAWLLVATSVATPVQAQLSRVVSTGDAAPGLGEGATFGQLDIPVMGRNGHVAFKGTSTVDALWAGRPGAPLRLVVKEGDTVAGWPSNVVINRIGDFVVSESGSVAATVVLQGAASGFGVVAEYDGELRGVLREGGQAPGYPAGSLAFLLARGIDGVGFPFAFARDTLTLAAVLTSNEIAHFQWKDGELLPLPAPGGDLSPALSGCAVAQQGRIGVGGIAGDGDFALAILGAEPIPGERDSCPFATVLEKSAGGFGELVSSDATAPGVVSGAVFSPLGFGLSPGYAWVLNDSGGLSFPNQLQGAGAGASGVWNASAAGELSTIALAGQSLRTVPNVFLLPFGPVAPRVGSNRTGNTVFVTALTDSVALLTGHPAPPDASFDIFDPGESRLTVLARTGEVPYGFDDGWYIEELLPSPVINNNDQIAFTATIANASDPRATRTTAIWVGRHPNNTRLVLAAGIPATVDGVETVFDSFFPPGEEASTSTNGGFATYFSDGGQIALLATESDGTRSILVSAADNAENLVQSAYLAYYGRPGDVGGLDWWTGRLRTASGGLSAIIDSFGNSLEFNTRFGGLDSVTLITNIYRNLFNRDPEPGGLGFWRGELESGARSLQAIALQVLFGAQGGDATIVENKLTVANYFTDSMRDRPGDLYTEADVPDVLGILAAVDETQASISAAKSRVDAFIGR